ncbi:MAG: hypothetical protein WC867_01460 [Candidatus Pacearchaeota archaeon]|jgi:hypothetical protein
MVDIKNIVLGIAIFILTVSVGVYGINTFYGKSPQYNDLCPPIFNEKECVDSGSRWVADGYTEKPIPASPESPTYKGYCDCQQKFDDAREVYSKGAFFIALPLGIVVIAIGAIVFGLASVGGGLMAGGVGILIYGVVGFWDFAEDILKFSLSLVGLIIIIALSYYANNRWFNKKKK